MGTLKDDGTGTPVLLQTNISKGAAVTLNTKNGDTVTGKAYTTYTSTHDTSHDTFIFTYPVSKDRVQPPETACYEGGLDPSNWESRGCVAGTPSTFTVDSISYSGNCTNSGKRTLQAFSLKAQKLMWECNPTVDPNATYRVGCPYTSYAPYYEYYQSFKYADDIVLAVLDDSNTSHFANFAQYFEGLNDDKKEQMVKKATAYMNAWMYAIREFEDAIDDCTVGDIKLNRESSGPVHAWDEGVAFYIGSLIEQDWLTPAYADVLDSKGVMAWTLANKRCVNFKTCGDGNNEIKGEAYVNRRLMDLFKLGKHDLFEGDCAALVPVKDQIVSLMTVPLVQGTLRYAYKTSLATGSNNAVKAEAAIFAASVLPQVYNCSTDAARTISDEMGINADGPVNFMAVKTAFEGCYEAMGITCQQVGGLWNDATGEYYSGTDPSGNPYDATPCGDPVPDPTLAWQEEARKNNWRPCGGKLPESSRRSRRRLAEQLEEHAASVLSLANAQGDD